MTYGHAAYKVYQVLIFKHFEDALENWDELCETERGVWESVAENIRQAVERNAARKASLKRSRSWRLK